MIFVRTGPRFLFLQSMDTVRLEEKIVTKLGGELLGFTSAMEKAGESDTIIFIVGEQGKVTVDMDRVLFVPMGSSVTLTKLVNYGFTELIEKAELGPGLLLQRVPRGGNKVIDTVQKHYGAKGLKLEEAIKQGGGDDTVIVFTDRPLGKQIRINEGMSPVLLVKKQVPVMYRELRQEGVRYFTEGLESGQWSEVRINIYDTDEQYEMQYKRIVLALEDLEAGLILGESWTRDHALALFSVLAYQVRLFTPLGPKELKQVLMGLEFDANGERFVDIDLYYRRKKIEKEEIFRNLPKNVSNYGLYFREQLFSRLSPATKDKIAGLEQSIIEFS